MKKSLIALAGVASMALSMTALADDFVISTGTEGGGYWSKGLGIKSQILKRAAKDKIRVDIEVIDSTGSLENISRLNDGDAHLILVQNDARNVMPITVPYKTKPAGREYIFWVYNVENDYDDFEDIEGNTDVAMVMVDDSGATVTMSSFVREDSGYTDNEKFAVMADDLEDAFDIVAAGSYEGKKVAGLLYVGSRLPQSLAAEFKGMVKVGSATDSDFDDAVDADGNDLYSECEITMKQAYGLIGYSDPDTVCVNAVAVYTTDLESAKLVKAVRKGTSKALRGVK